MLREKGFAVEDLALSASSGRTHVALSLRKRHDSEPRQVLHFLLAGVPYLKHAVVVDEDIDVQDPRDVEWAIATRVQGDEDLVMMPGLRGRSIDPSHKKDMFGAKVGIDATVRLAEKPRFRRIGVPTEVSQSVAKRMTALLSSETTIRNKG